MLVGTVEEAEVAIRAAQALMAAVPVDLRKQTATGTLPVAPGTPAAPVVIELALKIFSV